MHGNANNDNKVLLLKYLDMLENELGRNLSGIWFWLLLNIRLKCQSAWPPLFISLFAVHLVVVEYEINNIL